MTQTHNDVFTNASLLVLMTSSETLWTKSQSFLNRLPRGDK